MRLLRLRVENFKGLAECEIVPAPRGVTLVVGPNEAGKSTLAQALDLLLEEYDSTRKAAVRAAQPVGRDVGPFVELEAESGPYRFLYRKRFVKSPMTELEITAPRPERLSGSDAHDRVAAILAESVDLRLWHALRVDQGLAVAQPDLAKAPALLEILERASGGDSDAGDTALYERIRNAYEEFYTLKTGRERKPLKDARDRAAEAAASHDTLRGRLEAIEADAERRDTVERELAAAREAAARSEAGREHAAARRDEVRALAAAAEKLEAEAEAVHDRRKRIQLEHQERLRLTEELDRATGEVREAEAALPAAVRSARDAEAAFSAVEAECAASVDRQAAAERALDLRRRDERHRADEEELAALERRVAARGRALEACDALRERLASLTVDDARLVAVEDASRRFAEARAALEAAAPRVTLSAMEEMELEVEGEPVRLARGGDVQATVEGAWEAVIPGVLRVRVSAGGDAASRAAAAKGAQGALDAALAEAGAGSVEDARVRHRARQEAAAELKAAEAQLAEIAGANGGTTPRSWSGSASGWGSTRPTGPPNLPRPRTWPEREPRSRRPRRRWSGRARRPRPPSPGATPPGRSGTAHARRAGRSSEPGRRRRVVGTRPPGRWSPRARRKPTTRSSPSSTRSRRNRWSGIRSATTSGRSWPGSTPRRWSARPTKPPPAPRRWPGRATSSSGSWRCWPIAWTVPAARAFTS